MTIEQPRLNCQIQVLNYDPHMLI